MKIIGCAGKREKEYLELLLEADPSEEMIDRYLEDGTLFALEEKGTPAAVAVVAPAIGGRVRTQEPCRCRPSARKGRWTQDGGIPVRVLSRKIP